MVAGSSGGIGGGGGWMWIPENNETKLSRCDVPRGRQSPVPAASSLYVWYYLLRYVSYYVLLVMPEILNVRFGKKQS
jgi:hypothetical protein